MLQLKRLFRCFRSEVMTPSLQLKQEMSFTYSNFKKDTETKVLLAFNVFLALMGLTILVIGAISKESMPLAVIAFVMSVVALFAKNLSIILWKILIMFIPACLLNVVIYSVEEYRNTDPPGSFFLLGNVLGMAEFMIVVSFKDTIFKIVFIIINSLVKVFSFHNNCDVETKILYGITLSFCVIFYFYYYRLERKSFSIFYDSREELRKVQSLLSNDLPTGVLVTDPNFEKTLYFNDSFRQAFKIEDSETHSFFEKFKVDLDLKFDDEDIQNDNKMNLSKFLKKFISEHTKEKEQEMVLTRFKGKSDKVYYYEIRIRKITWDLKPACALIFNDISDKEIVMALRFADKQKDRVIATLSHELKTPINGILGFVRILKARIEDNVSQSYLDHCESCSKLLLNLINSILDLKQIREGKLLVEKSWFDLDELLKEIKSLYLLYAEQKNIKFTMQRDPDTPNKIYTDKHKLTIILITFLGNAFKFTFKGTIEIKVSQSKKNLKNLMFSVIDTSVGFLEEKKKIFTMFGKTSNSSKDVNSHGAGLGLTVINELLRVLNHEEEGKLLDFESSKQGTKFYFEITNSDPTTSDGRQQKSLNSTLRDYEVEEVASPDEKVVNRIETVNSLKEDFHFMSTLPHLESREHSCNSLNMISELDENEKPLPKNILVVDDNPFNILAVSFILEKLQCKISKAFNGQECLEILEQSISKGEKFDLILMDIQMPVLDGIQTSQIIKFKIENGLLYLVPIVALTANKLDEEERNRYKENGIINCLAKPLKEAELWRVLEELNIRKWNLVSFN